jgi:hypothetical protein
MFWAPNRAVQAHCSSRCQVWLVGMRASACPRFARPHARSHTHQPHLTLARTGTPYRHGARAFWVVKLICRIQIAEDFRLDGRINKRRSSPHALFRRHFTSTSLSVNSALSATPFRAGCSFSEELLHPKINSFSRSLKPRFLCRLCRLAAEPLE